MSKLSSVLKDFKCSRRNSRVRQGQLGGSGVVGCSFKQSTQKERLKESHTGAWGKEVQALGAPSAKALSEGLKNLASLGSNP